MLKSPSRLLILWEGCSANLSKFELEYLAAYPIWQFKHMQEGSLHILQDQNLKGEEDAGPSNNLIYISAIYHQLQAQAR